MTKKRKKALTLLEIMIVIFLIGVIGSVVGFNMKSSMDKAKVFKTETAMQQLEDVLNFELTTGALKPEQLSNRKHLKTLIHDSGMARKAEDLLQDGWNEYFTLNYDQTSHQVKANSARLDLYKASKKGKKEAKQRDPKEEEERDEDESSS